MFKSNQRTECSCMLIAKTCFKVLLNNFISGNKNVNYGCSLSTGRSVVGNPNRHWYRVVSFFKILKNDKRAIKLASSLCIIWCCFSLCIYRRKISRPGKILVSVWYGETFISFLWPSVGKYDQFLVIFVWNI